MLATQRPGLYVIRHQIKKRCVHTVDSIKSGEIIELCPVIIIGKEDTKKLHETHLHDYYFVWDIDLGTSAIALGYGSLYNHSEQPNADFELVPEEQSIRFLAVKDIEAGGEITIDYLGMKDTDYKLWFMPD